MPFVPDASLNQRIAVLTKASNWAGAEIHSAALVEFLRTAGHDAFLACIGDKTTRLYETNAQNSVPIVKIEKQGDEPEGFWFWYRAFKTLAADVCIYEKPTLHAGNFQLDIAARLVARRYLTIQQLRPPELPTRSSKKYMFGLVSGLGVWWYQARFRGYIRSLAPHINICVSESVRKNLCEQYAFPVRKTLVVFNGADTSKFRPDEDRYAALRNRLGLTPDTIIFGSACRLSEEKGLDIGLDCFQQLVTAMPDRPLAWVIAGDGPLRQQIVDTIREKGLGHRVFQIGFQKDMHELFPGFDFFLLPSRREGLPLSLLESMACGCCPITTSVDGIPEVLGSTDIGWMVPSDDRTSLASAMLQAAKLDPSQRRELASRSRNLVVNRFESKNCFAEIARLATVGLNSSGTKREEGMARS